MMPHHADCTTPSPRGSAPGRWAEGPGYPRAPSLLLLLLLTALAGCARQESPSADSPTRQSQGPAVLPVRLPEEITSTHSPKEVKRIQEIVRKRKLRSIYQQPSLPAGLALTREYSRQIQEAAEHAGLPPWLLRGLVVVEAGGQPDAIDHIFLRGRGRYAHVGLCQIGPSEALQVGLKARPGLEADVKASIRRLSRLEEEAARTTSPARRRLLEARMVNLSRRLDAQISRWKKLDDRFDPERNLQGAGRLLREKVLRYNGDLGLAVASYHAGGGNIDQAIRLYFRSVLRREPPPDRNRVPSSLAGGSLARARQIRRERDDAFRSALAREGVRYLDLYSQQEGPVYEEMSGWSDNSRYYLWKVLAAADIADRYLNRPEEYQRESSAAFLSLATGSALAKAARAPAGQPRRGRL